jgi:long-chain acyl-CoA synthetase
MIMVVTGNETVLIANPRDIRGFVRALKSVKMAGFCGLNTLFVALCRDPDFAALDFSHLRVTVSGGMALTQGAAEHWKAITGSDIHEGYGLTETSPVVAVNPGGGNQLGTVGIVVPSTEVCTQDAAGTVLAIGEVGELCVRGPQVMQGYWQRPEETAKVLDAKAWLHTGDVAIIQADGYVRIVDRMKDMILVSGFNVYPNEVEDVISRHPDVLECAVISVPDEHSGEAVKAVVVAKNPSLSSETVRQWCKQQLAAYKVPKHVEFRDSLPKSAVGKVLRRELRDGPAVEPPA